MAAIGPVWILSDGKIGDLVQCRGVADRLGAATLSERTVKARGMWALPLPMMPVAPNERPDQSDSPIAPPYPDVVIASGRRTLPYLTTIRARSPGTKIVFLKDPRLLGRRKADFVWAPVHDRVRDDGRLLATHTSPHGLTSQRLEAARRAAPFPSPTEPVTGIVLGGNSGAVKWAAESCADFAGLLARAVTSESGTVLVTTSRRTPAILRDAVATALPDAWFDPDGSAYLAILAVADRLIVTGDSHNMVSEALATGAPVHVYRPPKLQKKLHAFLDAMEAEDAVRPLAAPLDPFAGKRIDASAEIAERIKRAIA